MANIKSAGDIAYTIQILRCNSKYDLDSNLRITEANCIKIQQHLFVASDIRTSLDKSSVTELMDSSSVAGRVVFTVNAMATIVTPHMVTPHMVTSHMVTSHMIISHMIISHNGHTSLGYTSLGNTSHDHASHGHTPTWSHVHSTILSYISHELTLQ